MTRHDVAFVDECVPGVSLEMRATRSPPLPPEVPFFFVLMAVAAHWALWVLHWDFAYPSLNASVGMLEALFVAHVALTTVEESLLVVKDLGFQVSSTSYLGRKHLQFLPKEDITSIFIHEYVYGSRVCMSLALSLGSESRLVIAFKDVDPGDRSSFVIRHRRANTYCTSTHPLRYTPLTLISASTYTYMDMGMI